MTGDYDIQFIMESMEDELIASYRRNLARHTAEEIKEGFQWPMWQLLKLKDLHGFDRKAAEIVKKYGGKANREAEKAVDEGFRGGALHADELLHKYGIDVDDINGGGFFKANQYQISALEQAIRNDLNNAGNAVLRMSDDVYRQTVFKAQMFYTSGVSSLWKAIDMANKGFLDRGYQCVQYKNGNRVNVASYAEMCLRTSKKKANMSGEGRRAAEYGVTLCQVTQYSACSPTCLPWQGRVYVDDVYADGQPDGKHPLLSEAIAGGLFHPNCRHGKQPYFEGVSQLLKPLDEPEIGENYEAEERQREIERNIRRFKRRAEGSLDRENQKQALVKVKQWQSEMRKHLKENPQLRRSYIREQISDFGRNPLYNRE
jgi:hypothetical protein